MLQEELSGVYDFSELCFLCNEWVFGSEAMGHHCQDRLRNLDAFLVYCDPPIHGGVLATAGYCPFCLTNARLPARMRMYQLLNHGKWLDHIQKHVQDLYGRKPAKCPHPRPDCAELFESVKQLQFHLQDEEDHETKVTKPTLCAGRGSVGIIRWRETKRGLLKWDTPSSTPR